MKIIINTLNLTLVSFATASLFNCEVLACKERGLKDDFKHPSLMKIYKQDPSVVEDTRLGYQTVLIPTQISKGPGPKNKYMKIHRSQIRVDPDRHGDFLYEEGTYESDSVHTFAVAWSTMLMYRQDLEVLADLSPNNDNLEKAIEIWDKREYPRLAIYPHAYPDEENAYYSRYIDSFGVERRELYFFSFNKKKGSGRVHTCQSLDIVSHETGHSVLDILHPEYFGNSQTQVRSFHEAFGDLTAMFVALNQVDQCEALYTLTKGRIEKESFLTNLAEQFGDAIGLKHGLRHLNQRGLRIDNVRPEGHSLSRVFTTAVYNTFVKAYKHTYNLNGYKSTGAEILFRVGQQLRRIFLQAVIEENHPSPQFSDFAFGMYNIALNTPYTDDLINTNDWAPIIKKQFERRGIPVEADSNELEWINQLKTGTKKTKICGTFHVNLCYEDEDELI